MLFQITESIGLSKDLATFVNLRIKETENAARLESLHQKIDNQIPENSDMGPFSNLRITAPRRKLLYDGPLTLTSRTGGLGKCCGYCGRIPLPLNWGLEELKVNFVGQQ
eukprot:sb/3477466/